MVITLLGGIPMSIKWDKRFEVGIDFMDHEHEEIINKMLTVVSNIDFELPSDEDIDLYIEFEEMVARHFNHEELLMRQYAYPDMDNHIEAHRNILTRISRFKEKYYTTGLNESDLKRIDSEVNYLFKLHLMEEDRELEVFVHEKMKTYKEEKLPV